MEIVHHGAVNGVTGSCHQLRLDNGDSLLVDCGLFQGAESGDDPALANKAIGFDLSQVKALLVTHCHIDHVGRIPYLLAAGFSGPIYATEATAQLLPLVIEDAIKVGVSRDARLIRQVLHKLQQQLVAVPYKQWFKPEGLSGVKAKFQVAGHILGSAYIELDIQQAAAPERQRVVFSGDLGAPYSPLLPAPKAPYRADTLVIESTYGDRCHESRRQRRARLQQVIERCLENKGTVLIPAFSIGRTQELLYELEEILHRQHVRASTHSAKADVWQYLDVIVDSPLAAQFTEQYRRLKPLWDGEARRKVAAGRHPLGFEQLLTINSHQQHLDTVAYLQKTGRAAIVIAASGMCTGGRMQNYLTALLPDERTDVLFVGYQAQGTPGRDIQRYGPRFSQGQAPGYVMLDGQRVEIRAGVYTIGGYSAHADQQDLVHFVQRMRHKPSHIRIVHGDEQAKQALRQCYLQLLPDCEVVIPR